MTLPARFILLCLGIILPYSLILLMPIHLLSFAILTLFGLDFIVGWFVRPRLEINRILAKRVTAGADFPVSYQLTNHGKRPLWDLVTDTLPLPRGLRMITRPACTPDLAGGRTVRLTATVHALRRGDYLLPSVRVASTFPFGLWCWGATGSHRQMLMVHPSFAPLGTLRLPIGRRYQPRGIALSSKIGESMEFLGCRDYREGDSLRHLHMRSWARTGQPVVREFCEEYLSRAALILDNHRPPPAWFSLGLGKPADPVFEAAVSLGAAIADHFCRHDFVVDLFAAGKDVYRFQSGRSLAYLENILDILACLQPQRPDTFPELSAQIMEEAPQLSGALFVLLNWDKPRQDLVDAVQACGASVRVILICGKQGPPPDLPPVVEPLAAHDILAGRCTAL